jgi:hypothetical protein
MVITFKAFWLTHAI